MGGLAAVIRRQVNSLAKSDTSGSVATGSTSPPNDVAALVARRVQAIDPADPDRPRKAFRVFLESVLLTEFGDNLVNDAGFHQLVDSVHAEMDADPELARAINDAVAVMLANTGPTKPA